MKKKNIGDRLLELVQHVITTMETNKHHEFSSAVQNLHKFANELTGIDTPDNHISGFDPTCDLCNHTH